MRYVDAEGPRRNPAFTNVVIVEGPAKTIYVDGQDSVDASGNIAAGQRFSPLPARSAPA